MKKQETLNVTIGDKLNEIVHSIDTETGKLFKDQENGLEEVEKLIEEELKKGLSNNWYPYNNFECSFSWRVK